MYIKYAKLNKYTRFYVSGIQNIEYRPNKKIQSIIGQNGSGKSSLLKELIPNVNDTKNEYDNGGYKEVGYVHNNENISISYFKDDNKHSFKINGEEQNQSGLITTQKKLIEDTFGLTKDIHELLLSDVSFTTMSINERKKWFTEIISDIDYKYALTTYDNVKQRIRELTSYIKLTRSKIIKDEEFMSYVNNSDEKTLVEKINTLNKYLEDLLSKKEPYKEIDYKTIYKKLDTLNNINQTLINSLIKYDTKLTSNINDEVLKIKAELEVYEERKKDISKLLEKNNLGTLDENDNTNDIKTELKEIDKEIEDIRKLNIYKLDLYKIEDIFKHYVNILPYLSDIDSEIKSHNGLIYDSDRQLSLSTKLNKLKNNINNIKYKIDLLTTEINTMNNNKSDEVTCPKCTNVFIPNYDLHKIKNMEKIKSKLEDGYNKDKKEFDILSKEYNDLIELRKLHSDFKSMFKNITYGILEYIVKETDDFKNTISLQQLINKINIDLENMLNYNNLIERDSELTQKLNILNSVNDSKTTMMFENIKKLQNDYTDVVLKINNNKDKLFKYTDIQNKVNKLKLVNDKITDILKYNKTIYKNEYKRLKNNYLSEIINSLKKEIHLIENDLLNIRNVKKRHKELTIELKDYEAKLKADKILLNLLSPSKGIIGKSVVTLINDILERMNDLINRVWTYDIKILPCDMEENDLNFKFPVLINNVKPIPDVSKGSSAIMEIINLAFKIVVMERLDMLDYPLVLDEFGGSMDPEHRIRAYNLIEELSKNHFSQIFMVSHFESMYSRFKDTDVIILNNDNLSYNGTYNEVIKIK